MHRAAKMGDTSKVLEFIDSGTDVNAIDSLQATALYWASSKRHVNLVECLLARGANVNARTKWGSTPLHAAADRGYRDVARLLVAGGADANATNDNDDAPLHAAAARGHMEIVQLLVFNGGADLNATNLQRRTPCDEARHAGMHDVVRFLSALVENAADRLAAMSAAFSVVDLPTSGPKSDVISHVSDNGVGVNSLEKLKAEGELAKCRDDLNSVRLKLKSCQDRLEDKSFECESLRAELAAAAKSTSVGWHQKTKCSLMTSNVSNDVVRTLLNCVSLANFSSARSALVSCVASSSSSRIERLRQFFVDKFADGGAWSLNDDYEIIGDRPVVSTRANLVFRIRHVKLGVLILKIMTKNLFSGFTDDSFNGDDVDDDESIPPVIPSSPYLLPVLYRFDGTASAFASYAEHLAGGGDFSRHASFLVVPEFETTIEHLVADRRRRRRCRFNENECLLFLIQVLSGIEALACSGIAHRNIRASCILINDGWRAVIADFDMAKRFATGDEEAASLGNVYAKSDLSAVGRVFRRLFADETDRGDDVVRGFSTALDNFLLCLAAADSRLDARVAVGVAALLLWLSDDGDDFQDEEDVAHWILREIHRLTMAETAVNGDADAGQLPSAERIDGELRRQFFCNATTASTWLAYKRLRGFQRSDVEPHSIPYRSFTSS